MLSNKKMVIICIAQYLVILAYHLIYSFLYGTMDQTLKCAVWSVCIFIILYIFCYVFQRQLAMVVNFTMLCVLITVTYVGYILSSLAFSVVIYFASCLIVSLFLNKTFTLTWCIESIIVLFSYTLIFPDIILKMVPSMFLFYGYILVYVLGCVNAYLLVALAQQSYAVLKKETIEAQLAGTTKTMFWGNISNEIRTPMNVINGMSRLLKSENLNPRAREYTDQIENASDILLNIVNDTLVLSQIETGLKVPVEKEYDIYNIIHMAIMQASRNIVKSDVGLVYCVNPNVPSSLIGDEAFVSEVVLKLINNALVFTNEGEVRVEVDINEKEKVKKGFVSLAIKVKDNGNGISEENLKNIFKGFDESNSVRTTEQESVGLSLKLCKSMIELIGGTIEVESTVGVGTTFIVKLEQQIGLNVGTLANQVVIENSSLVTFESISPNVLVVDDTPTNLKLISGMIKIHGINPDVAESGKECLDMMKEKKYDLVFLDIMMSGLSGEDTLKEIHDNTENIDNYKEVPVIALTTKSIMRDRARFLELGFDEFISKPVDDKELVALLKKFLKDKY